MFLPAAQGQRTHSAQTKISIPALSDPSPGLIQNDWETLARETTIRYFSPDSYYPSQDPDEIWDVMGENITCSVEDGGLVTVKLPQSFQADKPFKMFTHGFSSQIKGDGKTAFVDGKLKFF